MDFTTAHAAPLATDRQVAYIKDLAAARELSDEHRTRLDASLPVMVRSKASDTISWLARQPLKTVAEVVVPATHAEVPSGRYAVEMDGVLKFYHVDRPTEGRWAGRTFVKVQASDDLHAIQNKQTRAAILAKIAEDGPRVALIRYGHELGKCGLCGRTLTDEASRAAGLGPICANK